MFFKNRTIKPGRPLQTSLLVPVDKPHNNVGNRATSHHIPQEDLDMLALTAHHNRGSN